MSKRLLLLGIGLLGLSMSVVEARHESRTLFAQLQSLQAERDALNTEWEQLLLEEGTWSEHRRVELMARTRLDMNIPGRDRIVVVQQPSAGTP